MESLFSTRWYRVAGVHPSLRAHVRVSRHIYRGQTWYLLQDAASGRHHRVDETAFHFIGRMDGARTVDEIWHSMFNSLGERSPTQDGTIELLCQLNENGCLQCEITPDVAELFRRNRQRVKKRRLAMLNPLAFRVPLADPDALLTRMAPLARVLFHPAVALVWLVIVATAVLSVAANWEAVRSFAAVHMLTPRYLMLTWMVYPFIKALHELGHGLAVKAWGGEVREAGISMLLLVPAPFVDASAASAFPEKYRRVAVGAAGIMVELMLAALAWFLWNRVSDGVIRDIAFVIMVVSGVSTVLFNGNPLLRFDGYYVFADIIDVPNLGQRGNAYLGYLAQRYLLGVNSATSPVTGRGEAPILFCYAVLAFFYRWFVTALIVMWAGRVSFWLGAAIGLTVLYSMVMRPLAAGVLFLKRAPQLSRTRSRGLAVAGALAIALLVVFCFVPMPFVTHAQGVVWLPEQARVRAGTEGFIEEVLAKDGQAVNVGDPILLLSDPELLADRARVQAALAALDVQYTREVAVNTARAKSIAEDAAAKNAELAQIDERIQNLRVAAKERGTLVMPRAQDLPGTFVAKGTVLAHVLRPEQIRVKVAVWQEDSGLIHGGASAVEVKLVDVPDQVLHARMTGEVPAATVYLPTAALGDRAGGPIVTDPTDKDGLKTLEPMFLYELLLDTKTLERVGARVSVRFDHGSKPLAFQVQRRLQQLFLKQFSAQA
jgi:putative peptide zinc metalloprotease protein